MKDFIFDRVINVVCEQKDNDRQGKREQIIDTLHELEPGKPDDGIAGFIAYNVPGKDRMKMKTGRFLTRKLGLNSGFLTDQQIQTIAEKINMEFFPDITIRLDKGEQITLNYRDAIGGASCMTDSESESTRLYESNPDRFQQLIMIYGSNSARAIVHKLDNGRYLLDRVYSDSEELKDAMRQYAIEHSWWYRTHNSPGSNNISNGLSSECIVSDLCYEDGEVPYMDTLTQYCIENGNLTIFHSNVCRRSDGELDSTNGTLDDENYITCENCGCRCHIDNSYCVSDYSYCESCYNEQFSFCECCQEDCSTDDMVSIDDLGIYVCQYCANACYHQCKDCDHYFSRDGMHTVDDDEICCESCLDNYTQCENCGGWFSTCDDDGYCEDCQDDKPAEVLPFVACKELDTGELFNG